MDSRLRRKERLARLSTIRSLFESGNSGFIYPLRYMWQVASEVAEGEANSVEGGVNGASVLFSVPKRNHRRANKRNLLKRRIREAYRLNKSEIISVSSRYNTHIDIALIYSTKELHQFKTVNRAVEKILSSIVKDIEEGASPAPDSSR